MARVTSAAVNPNREHGPHSHARTPSTDIDTRVLRYHGNRYFVDLMDPMDRMEPMHTINGHILHCPCSVHKVHRVHKVHKIPPDLERTLRTGHSDVRSQALRSRVVGAGPCDAARGWLDGSCRGGGEARRRR